jgi:hypothetical protein
MKIINNLKPTGTYIQQVTQGQVFTVDNFNFFIWVSSNEPLSFGVETDYMRTLSDEIEGHYLGVDLGTGELASFARNTVVIPVPNFVGKIENEVSNA